MTKIEADLASLATMALTQRCAAGDAAAHDELFAAIYADLRQRAHHLLRLSDGATLSTTALVHETYLKLSGSRLAPQDRAHFFAIAARAMRQVLLNAARDRNAIKRGGGLTSITLSALTTGEDVDLLELLALDAALVALATQDERLAHVVELHFFGGLGFTEIATMLTLSERTVARDWRTARAILRSHMGGKA